jgi:hypothetical protein
LVVTEPTQPSLQFPTSVLWCMNNRSWTCMWRDNLNGDEFHMHCL